MESLGLILKAARARQGLSLREAGRKTGVAATTLMRLERGLPNKPHAAVLAKLASFYELSLESLILASSSSHRGGADNGQSGPESVAKPTTPAPRELSYIPDPSTAPPIEESQTPAA